MVGLCKKEKENKKKMPHVSIFEKYIFIYKIQYYIYLFICIEPHKKIIKLLMLALII